MLPRLSKFTSEHFVVFDLIRGIILGGILVGVLHWMVGDATVTSTLKGHRGDLYATTAQITATLAGFTLTVVPIVHALLTLPSVDRVRKNHQVGELFTSFFHSMVVFATATVLALSALFADQDDHPRIFFPYLLMMLAIVGMLTVWRSVWILRSLITASLK